VELSVLIFLGVTLGLYYVLSQLAPSDRAKVRKRIREEFHAAPADETSRPLFKDLDVLSSSLTEGYALSGEATPRPAAPRKPGLGARLERLLEEAALPLRPVAFLLVTAAAALGSSLAGAWLFRWPGALVGCAAGAALPFALAGFRRNTRREKFLKQLPGAFQLMARVIRSGQAVPQAFQAVGDAFEEPLVSEFTRCQRQQNLGLPPEVVFREMANRAPILELRIFVMAMLIHRQAGGNLSEVLERLANLIRARQVLRQQVRTLTAEGRLQGYALVVLPFVIFAAMYFLNRSYALVLLDHGSLLGGTAALMAIGLLWIRNIVNFDA
jgi:tight adherence protein B